MLTDTHTVIILEISGDIRDQIRDSEYMLRTCANQYPLLLFSSSPICFFFNSLP